MGSTRQPGRLIRSALSAPTMMVGGQAVIEGVMMRTVGHWAVAVRTPDGEIAVTDHQITPWAGPRPLLRLPLIRGVIALGESLVIGMKALAISASQAAGEDEDGDEVLNKAHIGLTIAFSLVISIGLFFVLPIFLTTLLDLESGFAFWAVEGVIRTLIFLAYIVGIAFIPDLKRVFQFHAAEHMAIHAYEAGDPIEAHSASKFSRLHVRCGTAFLLIVMVISIFVFAAVGKPALQWLILSRILGVPIVAGLSYEVIRWAGKNQAKGYVQRIMTPGLWLQGLTTRRCDIEHLEVACASLNRVLDLEAKGPKWSDKVEVMA
jgi:uncharacterized protein YqhQ